MATQVPPIRWVTGLSDRAPLVISKGDLQLIQHILRSYPAPPHLQESVVDLYGRIETFIDHGNNRPPSRQVLRSSVAR